MFSAVFDLNKLDGKNGFKVEELNEYNQLNLLGSSVSTAGDINGDSIDDMVIGSPGVNNNMGASYVIFGQRDIFTAHFNLAALNGNNGFIIPGLHLNDHLGASVSTAGDFNGDGIDDFVLGAPSYNGASYVIFGQKNSFPASFNLATLNGTNGFTVSGIIAGGQLGSSVSTAGDINGDGIDDIVLGAPSMGSTGSRSYIIFGQKNSFPASFNLASLNGNNGFTIMGLKNSFLGYSVSAAGDINKDGVDDVLLGAPYLNGGTCYIIFGRKSNFPATFTLATLNGNNGFAVPGLHAMDYLGGSVNRAGDINGDGIDDIVLGAPSPYPPNTVNNNQGASYIIFGHKNGFLASFNLNTLNGHNGFTVLGLHSQDHLGSSVSAAGDINGDSIDDVVLGAYGVNQNEGASYVILGQKSVFPASFNLATLNGNNGFSVPGLSPKDYLGNSVSTARDINSDGISDIVLGAKNVNNEEGASYIIFGQSLFTPTLLANNLLALQGQAVTLTSTNLNATDPRTPSSELVFIPYQVSHGWFEYASNPKTQITQFTQHNVSSGTIQFRTDNSGTAPSYAIIVKNNLNYTTAPPALATIIFHDAPVLKNNRLFVIDRQSTPVTSADLSATEKYTPEDELIFTIRDVQHGWFQFTNASSYSRFLHSNITQFSQLNVTNGIIQFVHDSSNLAPSYTASVSDKQLSSNFMPANITFHDAPVLGNNQLTITEGQAVVLTQGYLSASEKYTPEGELIFKVSNVQHGQFINLDISSPSSLLKSGVVTEFAQRNITNGIIQFIQDGSAFAPSYSILVSDGQLASGAPVPANITFKITNNGSNTSLIDKMGGWGGIAGIIIGGILLICTMSILSGIGVWRYLKSRKPRMINITKLNDSNRNDATEISSVLNDAEKQPFLQAYGQNNLDPIEALPVGDALSKELDDSTASELLYPASLHQETRQEYSSLSENSPKLGRFGMFRQKPTSTQSVVKELQHQAKKLTNEGAVNLGI